VRVLSSYLPDWSNATPSATVKHYMYAKQDPLRFYVYPPQPTSSRGYVEMLYAKTPTVVTAGGNNISVVDSYFTAIVAYVMFRCWSKDAEAAANAALASAYYQQYLALVGAKTQGEMSG
jgi:hypothetical protein